MIEIVAWPEAEVPAALKLEVARLQHQAWPGAAGPTSEPVHDPALDPLSLLGLEGGRVVAALDILSKRIEHAGRSYAASGLSTVVTDEAERRRGHGRSLVEAARDAMRDRGADVVLFTCDRPLRGFYEAAGFDVLPGTVLVGGTPAEPLRSDAFDKVTLGRFHAASRDDFVGREVALYPGTIDRLW